MDKRRERIERFKSNAEVQRKLGDLQGCLEFRELAEELEKLDKIRQIYRQWAEIGDNADCWAFKEITKVIKDE